MTAGLAISHTKQLAAQQSALQHTRGCIVQRKHYMLLLKHLMWWYHDGFHPSSAGKLWLDGLMTRRCVLCAGMEEGGFCCWDLAEPGKAHRVLQSATAPQLQSTKQQQQPRANIPFRRPSYSAGLPLFAGASSSSSGDALATGSSSGQDTVLTGMVCDGALAAGGVVGLAAVPSTSASSGSYGGAAGAGGGAVCRLVVLSAGGCVTLYSVMLGDAGSDMAVTDLGMRSGERWVG